MAELIPPMIVSIEARIGQLETEMKKATQAVDQFGKQAKANQEHTNKLTDGFKRMAGAIGGLFALHEVTKLLSESAKAAVEDNKSQALLERQIIATTGASKEQVAGTEQAIRTMSEHAAVMDDKIRPAMATLVRATGNLGEATKLTNLALDVSAGTGRSLEAVSIALAKAHNGNAGALQRLGISLKGVADPMAFLQKTFKGAAETAANTDPYQRMTVALDHIKESIGKALLPMLSKFVDWLDKIAPKIEKFFQDINDPTTEVGKKWKTFTDILKTSWDWLTKNLNIVMGVAAALITLKTSLLIVEGAQKAVAAAQWLINVAMEANPVYALIGLLALLVGAYVAVAGAADNATEAQKRAGSYVGRGGSNVGRGYKAPTAAANASGVMDNYNYAVKTGTLVTPTTPTPGGGGAGAKKADPFVDYLKNTQKQILAARDNYDKAIKAANDKYGALIQQYADEMTSIIKQSMDRLRNVFATATATDVGAIFKNLQDQGNATADQLLKQLQDKLNAGRKLAENAASLAGLGYSQTFIEQVISQGTDTGNALAEALKIATPEQAKAIQDTFRQTEVLSNTGMDGLAKSLYEKSGLATDELKTLFDAAQTNMVKAQKDLQDALAAAAQSLNDSLTAIEATFTAKLASMGKKAAAYKGSIAATFGMLATNFVDTSGGVGSVININTTANTNASPETIAQATLNAAKFGMPAII